MKKGHRFKNSVLFRLFCCKTLALMAVYLFFRRFLGWYRVTQIGALLLKRTAVRDQQGQTKLPLLIKDGDIAQICSAASRASPVARTALPGALAASPITSTWPATFSAVSFRAVLEREPMASTMLS